MPQITEKYIEEHSAVHTAKSWARALIEQVLKGAQAQIKASGAKDVVEVPGKITVSVYEPQTCINVCATYNGVTVCYHVNV